MLSDLVIILFSGLMLYLVSSLTLPWILSLNLDLPDKGWGWGKIAGWLAIGVPIWGVAHLGIPVNTRSGVWLVIVILASLAIIQAQKNWRLIKRNFLEGKPYILVEECLFWAGFIFLSLVRGFNPDVNGLEKFMDHGFMEGYLRSPTLPATDMWLTGFDINYYTFGHFQGSIMMRVWGVLPEIGYNLLLALILGLTLTHVFQFVVALIDKTARVSLRSSLFAGVIGSFLVNFAGNTQAIWYFLTNHTWNKYWYPDATRFIPNTIHEFPAYSYIVSDLHGHVWNMAMIVPLLLVLLIWFEKLWQLRSVNKFSRLLSQLGPWSVIIGALLGLMASTSTWGTMVYGTFLAIGGVMALVSERKFIIYGLVISAAMIGLSALITASPWFFNFESISEGVRMVVERSSVRDLLILWTGHVTIASLAALSVIRLFKQAKASRKAGLFFVLIMFVTAILLLALPEIIYFKDIYPTHPRANTMFKLTFQAFILMLLITGWLIGFSTSLKNSLWKKFVQMACVLFIAAVMVYPYFGYRDFYGGLKKYRGLNGLTWLEAQHPTDFAAIKWLKQNTLGRPVVLEGVGESYTTFARVSTFTGLPTVLGWRVHEWLWRGSFDIPGQRSTEVENIYLQPLSYSAQVKLNEYKVEYIFVGDKEREAYPTLSTAQLKQLGRVVFEQGNTFIVQRAVY